MRPTWQQLTRLEPRLKHLHKKAKSIMDDPHERYFCANHAWYGYWAGERWIEGLKKELVALIGWSSVNRKHPVLGGMDAYDVAYRKIYDALPDCRGCGCLG